MLERLESHLTYKPTQNDYGGLKRQPPLTEAFIYDEFQNKIHIVYRTADSSHVILFTHGRDGNVTKFGRYYDLLESLGYSYISFDYPGFGRSTGIPTEKSLFSSANAVLEFGKRIFPVDASKIVLFGLSLGAAVSLELASNISVRCLILESPFISSRAMGKYILGPLLPLYFLVPNRFRNDERIASQTVPILLLNGTADKRIPSFHSNELYKIGGGPRTLVTVDGAGHLDIIEKLSPNYRNFMLEFIANGSLRFPSGAQSTTVINSP